MPAIKNHKPYVYTKKTGRPITQTLTNDLPENWKEIMLNCFAKGYSEVEVRAHLCGVNVTRWYTLEEKNDEFRKVHNIGRRLCEAWWTAQARKALGKNYWQSFMWFKNMQNRFGWRDKQDVEHSLSESTVEKFAQMSIEQLEKKANELISRNVSRISIN